MPKLPDHLLNVKDMDGVRHALKALSDNQISLEQQFDNFSSFGSVAGGGEPVEPGEPGERLRGPDVFRGGVFQPIRPRIPPSPDRVFRPIRPIRG